jgi:hypothetical protein
MELSTAEKYMTWLLIMPIADGKIKARINSVAVWEQDAFYGRGKFDIW